MALPGWSIPDFSTADGADEQDSYLSKLNAFLLANPAGSMGNQPLSSPEASNNSSPASSESASLNLLSRANVATLSSTAHSVLAHDKRKTAATQPTSARKDRRDEREEVSHTHGAEDDDDEVSGAPATGKTTDRRRAQNRQAQRAFRERKEKHLKDLEDRVFSLEQTTTDQGSENNALKQLLVHLQSENERLKVFENAFSFSYDTDVAASSTMPTSSQFGGKTSSAQRQTSQLAPGGLASFSSSFGPFSPSTTAVFAGGDQVGASSALDDFSFFHSFAPSPTSTNGGSMSDSSSVAHLPPVPATTATSLSTYRSPVSMPEGEHRTQAPAALRSVEEGATSSIPGPTPCPGPAFEFDLDGLCSAMEQKASCQEAARQALVNAMKEDEIATNLLFPKE